MLFWVLIALVVLLTVFFVWREMGDSYGMPVMTGFLALFLGVVVAGLIFLACSWFIPQEVEKVSTRTHALKSMGTSSALNGRAYFLGGGYINEKRVLNYISQREAGAIRVEQAEAEDSVIFEDTNKPTVTVDHYDYLNKWVSPWPIWGTDKYTFHIPAGSVVESYSLDNK
jgi:hypothetical protein